MWYRSTVRRDPLTFLRRGVIARVLGRILLYRRFAAAGRRMEFLYIGLRTIVPSTEEYFCEE